MKKKIIISIAIIIGAILIATLAVITVQQFKSAEQPQTTQTPEEIEEATKNAKRAEAEALRKSSETSAQSGNTEEAISQLEAAKKAYSEAGDIGSVATMEQLIKQLKDDAANSGASTRTLAQ